MSCPNATAPIDISKDNITGKCDLKCEFSFHYNDSSCIDNFYMENLLKNATFPGGYLSRFHLDMYNNK